MNLSHYSSALLVAFTLSHSSSSISLLSSSLAAVVVGVFAFTPVNADDPDVDVEDLAAAAAAQQCQESDGSTTCGAEKLDESSSTDQSQQQDQPNTKKNPDGQTIISHSELASHITIENRIWLSILGKVYDVTEGDAFYGFTNGSYKFYAGRDASPCFSTGNNTPEGADEKIEEWTENSKLIGVYEWAIFYENHEVYKFMGVLGDSRYYDANGIETSVRRDIVSRASAAKEVADAEREKRKKERMDAKMERRKKLYG